MSLPRRVVVDVSTLQGAHRERGIARYVAAWVEHLPGAGVEVAALVLDPDLPPPSLPSLTLEACRFVTGSPAELRRLAAEGPCTYVIGSPVELDRPAEATFPRHVLGGPMPVAAIAYDVIPALFPEHYLPSPEAHRRYDAQLRLLERVDLALAISECTRRDLLATTSLRPEQVAVIGGGVDGRFSPWGRSATTPSPAVGAAVSPGGPDDVVQAAFPGLGPFVLCVAGFDWRKDVEGLLRGWGLVRAELRSGRTLVLACEVPAAGRRAWEDEARAAGLGPTEVLVTGRVDDDLLLALYRSTELFVFPSRYEGFGLPLAEAAACGAAVLTSDASSLPEVIGDPRAWFRADDPASMGRAMEAALGDPAHLELLRAIGTEAAVGHTWERVAERTVDALDAAPSPSSSASPARRPRIALVGPFPPSPSGIGRYDHLVSEALGRIANVDCFVDGDLPGGRPPDGVRWFPSEALGDSVPTSAFDAIVHVLGNSGYHVATWQRFMERGGVAWLHDADLSQLHVALAHRLGGPEPAGFARQRLAACYGGRLPQGRWSSTGADRGPTDLLDAETYVEAGLLMTGEVVGRAGRIIVSSHHSLGLVRADAGRAWPVGSNEPHVIPLACAQPPPPPPQGNPDVGDLVRPIVVVPGWVHSAKAPEVIIDAFSRLPTATALLVFVGPIAPEPGLRSRLEAIARGRGVGERVSFTGWVDDTTYWSWFHAATVAVFVRRRTHGESSAALTDALAVGLPVITNLPSARELPDGTVHLLPAAPDATTLAAALAELLGHDDARQAQAARARGVAAERSFDAVAATLLHAVVGDRAGSV